MMDDATRLDVAFRTGPLAPIRVILLHVEILGVLFVVLGGFWFQFAEHELPCPLCLLQRMGMLLATLGPAYVLIRRQVDDESITPAARAGVGFGMSVLAGMLGMSMAARQVLLHIMPGDPGYGDAVMGMHLYSWAVVVFVVVICTSGITLLFHRELAPGRLEGPMPWWTKATLGILLVVIVANILNAIAIAGFHPFLPDNPEHYLLFGGGEGAGGAGETR